MKGKKFVIMRAHHKLCGNLSQEKFHMHKYCVTWNPSMHKVMVYYNGHTPGQWDQKWAFDIDKDNSVSYIMRHSLPDPNLMLRYVQECPAYIPSIAQHDLDRMIRPDHAKIMGDIIEVLE